MAPSPREFTPLTALPTVSQPARGPLRARAAAFVAVVLVLLVGVAFVNKHQSVHAHIRSPTTATNRLFSPSFTGSGDEIVDMPGMPTSYTSRLFSGYLPIPNGAEGFYFYAESQSETPEKDPVLLWLNGGPGASSLMGCFSENGPLLVNEDGKTLRVNTYAWNQNANMLCIESPVGVGFSYNASGVYASDDSAQADDLYEMLQSFFTKYPSLRQNDFIISGESYAGMYVPMTAKRIVQGNQNKNDATKINLKKFVVGNGENEYLPLSEVTFAYYHGLISTDEYLTVGAACPALLTPGTKLPNDANDECLNAIEAVSKQLQSSNINNYNIYATCAGGDGMAGLQSLIDELNGPLQATPRPVSMSVTACLDSSELRTYFNLPAVRTALHTNPEIAQWNNIALTSANFDLPSLLNKSVEEITPILQNKVLQYQPTENCTVTPLWKFLIDNGVRGLIYHGDIDMACNFIGGLWAVESLQLPHQQPRAVWKVAGDDQTAGFVEDFGMLQYVTVKGAGHMVPTDKPREAKAMVDQFVLQ